MKFLRTCRHVCGYLVLLSPAVIPAAIVAATDGVHVVLMLVGCVVSAAVAGAAIILFGLWLIEKD